MASLAEIQDVLDGVAAERAALTATIIERTLGGEPMVGVVNELAATSGWAPFELALAVAEALSKAKASAR